MKAAIITLLAASGAAHAQLNRSFEQGDFTGYAIHDGDDLRSQIVETAMNGQGPSHGQWLAKLEAGGLTQGEAEALLDLAPGRLAKLYTDLGGTGEASAGDYNVLSVDLASGTYRFDYMFEEVESNSAFVDHAFVINSAGQITVLGDSITGSVAAWTEATVSHAGGELFFVVANGGDVAFPAYLYLDDTLITDPHNGSFETQDFDEWTIDDAGAGNAFVTSEFIEGFGATHGFYFARVPAGNVDQAGAEQILGLEPGRLAQLYIDLGGTGDASAGDYKILSQRLGGSSVSMDVVFTSGDAGSAEKLDHAFCVDSEGNITVLASTLDLVPDWDRKTVTHSGGEFFIVCANGGDTAHDATLYVDDVVEGPVSIDSSGAWDGSLTIGNFGGFYKQTIGQLIEPLERSRLERVKFYLAEEDADEPFQYRAYVYEWDGAKIVGNALFSSGTMWTDGAAGGELVLIDTPGVTLEKTKCYIAFLTTTITPSLDFGHLGMTEDVIPGMILFNGGDEFQDLFAGGWLQVSNKDLAFEAELAPVFSQVVPEVNQFVEGASLNQFPWNGGGDWRYQQLYGAEQFNGQHGVIDSFAYRVQHLGDAFGPVDIDVQIWMGYSDYEPGELTKTFDANWAFGKTLVHDGPVTLSSAGLGGFDIVVDVDNLFLYNPDAGNLLVEIVFPSGDQPSVPQFDSAGYGFALGGTPWTDRVFSTSATAPTGLLGGDDGHVTRFQFVGQPEAYDPDCNGDGELNILDFVCFQLAFQSGDPQADCDANGALNILDFVCFQIAFQNACG